jgi:thioredoxin 1
MSAPFSELIKSPIPTLVDFSAEWCGPCQAMKPILSELKGLIGDSAKIIKIDVDKNPSVSQFYKIQGVPTIILFKDGIIKWRQSGVVSARELQKVIQENG